LGGKLALGQTGAGGTGGEEILRGEVAQARPVEIAVFSDSVWHSNLVLWPTVIRSGAAVHDPGK
jgi:hypothetical protein